MEWEVVGKPTPWRQRWRIRMETGDRNGLPVSACTRTWRQVCGPPIRNLNLHSIQAEVMDPGPGSTNSLGRVVSPSSCSDDAISLASTNRLSALREASHHLLGKGGVAGSIDTTICDFSCNCSEANDISY